VKPLDKVVGRAYEMFLSKAFLYQYEKHNIMQSDFEESFIQLEQIIQDYKQLSV
jgi:tubulin delta